MSEKQPVYREVVKRAKLLMAQPEQTAETRVEAALIVKDLTDIAKGAQSFAWIMPDLLAMALEVPLEDMRGEVEHAHSVAVMFRDLYFGEATPEERVQLALNILKGMAREGGQGPTP